MSRTQPTPEEQALFDEMTASIEDLIKDDGPEVQFMVRSVLQVSQIVWDMTKHLDAFVEEADLDRIGAFGLSVDDLTAALAQFSRTIAAKAAGKPGAFPDGLGEFVARVIETGDTSYLQGHEDELERWVLRNLEVPEGLEADPAVA